MWSVNRLLCILYMAINGQSGLDSYRIGLYVLCLMFNRSKMEQDYWQDLGIAPYRLRNADKRVKECTVRSRFMPGINQSDEIIMWLENIELLKSQRQDCLKCDITNKGVCFCNKKMYDHTVPLVICILIVNNNSQNVNLFDAIFKDYRFPSSQFFKICSKIWMMKTLTKLFLIMWHIIILFLIWII